jgi:hypothetical protein
MLGAAQPASTAQPTAIPRVPKGVAGKVKLIDALVESKPQFDKPQ